jgi:hypothetical protein
MDKNNLGQAFVAVGVGFLFGMMFQKGQQNQDKTPRNCPQCNCPTCQACKPYPIGDKTPYTNPTAGPTVGHLRFNKLTGQF